jgi:endonuclease YncB( thermonuclease family)
VSKQLVPSPSTYPALREEVLRALQEGKERARQAVEHEKVQTYWEVGRILRTHLLAHRERANYREQVLARLSQDVGIGQRRLYEMLSFHRAFPILRTSAKLGWSHYCALLSLPTQAKRSFYEREASGAGWSVRELEAQIRAGAFEKGVVSAAEETAPRPETGLPLLPKRGWLYTYRVVESPAVDGEAGSLYLDLGFNLYYAPETDGTGSPASGRIVESLREKKAPGRYRFRVSRAGEERLYTYRAVVEEVIDGDTFWTRVDCGFRAWTRQKLRLRGIDAPELSTLAGRRTRDFVSQALSEVPFVVLTTTKPDKYDRYLSDLFYLRGGTDPQEVLDRGTFLNQQLLDRGLAVRFAG